MSGHLGDAGDGEEDDWFRPVWEDGAGEDGAGAAPPWASPAAVRARRTPTAGAGWDRDSRASAALLGPALAAADALARLDARAGAAGEAVREGLARRLALHEAAGWLAAQAAWVHPLDLALRAGHVAGPFGLAAAAGRTHAEMPNTAAACHGPAFAGLASGGATLPSATSLYGIGGADGAGSGWETLEDRDGAGQDDPFAAAHADGAAGRALRLARALERLALLGTRDPLRGDAAFGEALAALGAGEPDPARAAAWRRDILAAVGAHRPDRGVTPAPLPPLLAAARSAQAWSEAGGDAAQALFGAAALLARAGLLRAVPLPFWAAYPVLGRGGGPGEGLPGVGADADAPEAAEVGAAWPAAFCRLAREAASAGSRELGRLEAAAEKGRAAVAGLDRRSRLPDALDAVLRAPALTSTALARRLRVAPQTATALLRDLLGAGAVREVTGRKHFRAWAA